MIFDASVASGFRATDQGASGWALFLDFDGTLVDIADHPDAIVMDSGLAGTLAALRGRLGGALAVVTGRPIDAIDRFLAPYAFDAAGLHGAERRIDGRTVREPPDDRLRTAVEELCWRLAAKPGVLIEDKGVSVAVHWRLAPSIAGLAVDAVQSAAAGLGDGYRVQLGKAVAEIVPASASKGRVIEHFLTCPPYRGRRPAFAGDDLTDEHGFESVNRAGGFSIRVGAGPTQARSIVESPAALRQRLSRWAAGEPINLDGMAAA